VVSAAESKHIVILGTNDFHGALFPAEGKTKDKEPVKYTQGGAAVLGAYVNAYRNRYKDRFLFLDAGDQWQGSLESNHFEGLTVVEVFNLMKLDAATIGNHEFDFGPVGSKGPDRQGALKKGIRKANFPYLSANLTVQTVWNEESHRLPGQKPFKLFTVDGVRIAVLGLTTEETPVTTRPKYVKNAKFSPLATSTEYYSHLLRTKYGANLVILLAHAGTRCKKDENLMENKIREKSSIGDDVCSKDEELTKLLKQLKPGTVDAVIGGHAHEIVHHWINDIPVIQSGKFGQYVHLLHIHYAGEKDRTKVSIEGPVPVCEKIFANQGNCDGRAKLADGAVRGELVQNTLFNAPVVPEASIAAYLARVSKALEPIKKRPVGKMIVGTDIMHEKFIEAPMGNLVADAVKQTAKTDFSLVNRGGIRDSWNDLNVITFGDVYRVLPYDNFIKTVSVTGLQLKAIIQQAYNSPDEDVWPVSGLQVQVNKTVKPFKTTIQQIQVVNSDTTPSYRLIDIVDTQVYTLAVPDFLAEGGDGMGKVFQGLVAPIHDSGFLREVLTDYLKPSFDEPIDPDSLVNSNLRRIIIK